jgi:hypothetical protein
MSEQSFEVKTPARLQVSNIRGLTEIRAGAAGVITIQARKIDGSGDLERTEIQISQESDGTVRVKTHFPETAMGWMSGNRPCKVEYRISAPADCILKVNGVLNDTRLEGFDHQCSVNAVSGDLDLRQLSGEVTAGVVSGNLKLESVSGTIKLNSVSGDISSERLSGSLDVSTVSGDVQVQQSALESIQANVTSGKVEAVTALGAGPYRFHSVSGDVRLRLPQETRCTAELHSISGGLQVKHLPQTASQHRNGRQVAEIQGGGVMVYLNSVSGDLTLAAQ